MSFKRRGTPHKKEYERFPVGFPCNQPQKGNPKKNRPIWVCLFSKVPQFGTGAVFGRSPGSSKSRAAPMRQLLCFYGRLISKRAAPCLLRVLQRRIHLLHKLLLGWANSTSSEPRSHALSTSSEPRFRSTVDQLVYLGPLPLLYATFFWPRFQALKGSVGLFRDLCFMPPKSSILSGSQLQLPHFGVLCVYIYICICVLGGVSLSFSQETHKFSGSDCGRKVPQPEKGIRHRYNLTWECLFLSTPF